MEMHSVAILGAGAIGAYFVYCLSKAPGTDLCLIAEGERKDRLVRDGLIINGETFHPAVKTPEEAAGADLLLIATKYGALSEALPDIARAVTPHTTVVSLLNGVDSEELIGTYVDPAQIPYAFMMISSERRGNSIFFRPESVLGLFIGEKDSEQESERLAAIRRLLREAGIGYHFCRDIVSEQWRKFTSNISYNLPQAVLGVPVGAYFDSEHVAFLARHLEEEVRAVADAYGISIRPLDDNRKRWASAARFSTLQDIDNGRHTEIEMFAGVLMKKAEKAGVKVPFTEYTYHAIKALEEKNDGLFDYD